MKRIYCADGNRRFMAIAREYGFLPGAKLPGTIYDEHLPHYFADQDWKEPDRNAYMEALAEYRPAMATVLDWERMKQLKEVLSWAEEATQYVDKVLIVPKVIGGIQLLPRTIGNKPVILAYSVPTRYGGTQVPTWEFQGWPVHLLGGSPQAQINVWHYLDIVSIDGNYAQSMATRHCQFWVPGTARYASNRWWPTLREANDGEDWGSGKPDADAPYEAFRRSCKNIAAAWDALCGR